jgi:hypothetical protein
MRPVPSDGGYRVTELWESEEAHTAWFEAHVLPTMPPDAPALRVTIQPLTNVATR